MTQVVFSALTLRTELQKGYLRHKQGSALYDIPDETIRSRSFVEHSFIEGVLVAVRIEISNSDSFNARLARKPR